MKTKEFVSKEIEEAVISPILYGKDCLVMRIHVGTGEGVDDYGKDFKFTLARNMDHSPMVIFEDGRKVSFSWDSIVQCAETVWRENKNELLEKQPDSIESDN